MLKTNNKQTFSKKENGPDFVTHRPLISSTVAIIRVVAVTSLTHRSVIEDALQAERKVSMLCHCSSQHPKEIASNCRPDSSDLVLIRTPCAPLTPAEDLFLRLQAVSVHNNSATQADSHTGSFPADG
jgi:hypothetical protein